MEIVNHSDVYRRPNGYYLDNWGIALCYYCINDYVVKSDDAIPMGISETDTPQHCWQCGSLIFEPLTTDGIEYVREVINNPGPLSRRAEVVECWAKAYSDYLPKEDY